MHWIVIIAVVLVFALVFLAWASSDIGSNVYIPVLCKGERNDKVVALTFDDGPNEETTPRVLDILKQHNIKATFFLIGQKAEKYPHLVQRMVDEGHIVANHTYSHRGVFPISRSRKVIDELQKCSDAIAGIIGKYPKLFRPPFGLTNPIIGTVVRQLDMQVIGWSIRSFDTVQKHKEENICGRVIGKLHGGAVILLHDRCKDADHLLQRIIEEIESKEYKVVQLNKMFNIEAYED